ncbi:MAG TPA: bifunctional glutamate N-acetyltransferase/amino-acid acetyltransferase ArgJ [Longimicrobiales bacterium]|nr:bifunctional glutamate N-acetyltransferase/amino-acid acetyltransferase ArgJ [Longimicrobiales bacterium]
MTEFHDTPVFPRGFSCASRNCGIKATGRDLSLFVSEVDAAAAAVFTRNHFPGAPVLLGRETIRGGVLRAVIVNSRVSNVGTGAEGLANARRMAAAAGAEVGCDPARVLVSSTGVIGLPLPIDRIEAGVRGMTADLQPDPRVGAEGIMTTDTYPKAMSLSVGDATITAVAKGSGMIAPNMATMLVYIFTDARVAADRLDAMLRAAVDDTFNMMSVDTDTSTSDTCAILANGLAGDVDESAFAAALHALCERTTELLARDGEGATKLLRVRVRGAASETDARTVARSLVDSPLIKTMAYGADPNVGRVLMAIGKCFDARVEPSQTGAWINGTQVIAGGMRRQFDEAALRVSLAGDPVEIEIDLGVGAAQARAWGCDLTEGYVRENAAYYSS